MDQGNGLPARPFVWRIERAKDNPSREELCFGRHRFALNDITAIATEDIRDSVTDGILLAAMAFVIVACALAFGVFDGPLRERFLLGTVFLGFLGYMGLSELPKLRQQKFFKITFTLQGGSNVTFASADRTETEALLAALALR